MNAYKYRTTAELEASLGQQIRALRLELDLDQAGLASRADVSISALRALEAGRGSSLRTLVRVTRALDRTDWLEAFHRTPEVSPLALLREREGQSAPRRASPRKKPSSR